MFAFLLVAAGTFAAFFLWSIGSESAYAAGIPILAAILLAVPARGFSSPIRQKASMVGLILGWVVFGFAVLAGSDGPRSLAYFLLVPASVALFLGSAILDPRKSWSVLVGIVGVFLLVRWSSYHAFATFQGSDSFFHAGLVRYVVETGHVAPVALADKYALTPGLHLLAAATQLVTGLNVSDAMFWSIALSHLALPLGLYALVSRANPSVPGLMGAALLAVDSTMVSTAINFNPVAYVVVLFVAILISLRTETLRSLAVFLLACVAAVATHQLSAFVVILVCASYGAMLLVAGPRRATSALPLLQTGFLVGAFVLVNLVLAQSLGITFANDVWAGLQASFKQATPGAVEAITTASSSLANNFLYKATLVATSGIAIAAAARAFIHRTPRDRALGFAALVTLGLAFGLPFVGIDLVADRWMAFALLAGLASIGLLMANWSIGAKAGLAALVIGVAFFGITQPSVAHDIDYYAKERNIQEQFDEPDLVAAAWSSQASDRALMDIGMTRLFRAYDALGYRLALSQVEGEARLPSPALLVVRESLLEDNRLHFALSRGVGFMLPGQAPLGFLDSLSLRDRVADEGAVVIYRV
jgi:hypothetical protein